MASISKLSIRGVRSFSPNDEEQVISFCFPLTIIVGANGCGKTTIIETLKYAVTGSLPPGIKSGQSFVHDPKSVGQSSVKASIKLRFKNRADASMVVIRSMEVQQKKASQSFKALDGILRTVDEDGKRVSLSHKCTELDRIVPQFMGVSKAVLEHVVFCHQEDSSWPLQEGAVLKKRFDDIFDSTRYAKALESIKASRKNYASIVKDLKIDLAGLQSHQHAAQGFRDELQTILDQISGIEDEIAACQARMDEQRAVVKEKSKVIERIDELENENEDKKAEVDRSEAVLANQREILGDDDITFKHSEGELDDMLRELDGDGENNQAARALEQKRRECEDMQRGLERLRKRTNELNAAIGKLEAEKEAHADLLRRRYRLMEEMHRKHKIELLLSQETCTQDDDATTALTQGSVVSRTSLGTTLTGGGSGYNVSDEDVAAFSRALKNKEEELRSDWGDAKRKHRRLEDEIQKEINELQAEKSTVDNERRRIETSKSAAVRELSEVSSQMSSSLSRVRKSDVADARRHAERLARERDDANSNPRREAIAREVKVQEDKTKSLQATIEQDSKVRDQLRRQSDQQNEIDMLERQAEQEYEFLEEKIKDNSYLIQGHGEHIRISKEDPLGPLETLAGNVRRKYLNAEDDSNRAQEALGELQKRNAEKKALMDSNRQRLLLLNQRANLLSREDGGVQKIKRIIRAVVRHDRDPDPPTINEDMNPTALLQYLTDQINDCSSHEDKPETTTRIMKRLKKMAKNNVECPCCLRAFSNQDELKKSFNRFNELGDPEVSELIIMSNENSSQIRSSLRNYENWRKLVSENTQEYLDFIRVSQDAKDAECAITEEGEAELENLEKDLASTENEWNEKKEIQTQLQQLLTAVNSIQDDAKRVWEKMGQVKTKKDHIKYMYCGDLGDDHRDLKAVENDLSKHADDKEAAYRQISKLNEELKNLNEHISRITNQAAAAERSAREKEDTYNRDQEASKRKGELNDSLGTYAEEDKALEKQLAPLRQKLMNKESDRDRLREANGRDEAVLSDSLHQFQKDVGGLQQLFDKNNEYVSSNKVGEFEAKQRELQENTETIRDENGRLNAMEPEIEQLKKQVSDGERQKKILQENLNLLRLTADTAALESEVEKLEEELASMMGTAVRKEYDAARKRSQEHQEMKARCEGRRQGLSDQKRVLKRKLNEEEYKNIDDRYRDKMIDHETTQIAVTDLDKYYIALDKALLRYHGMKIDDINKIIRELWTLTYKGQDITNIQIVSGQENSSRANRSYNYRIVMSKGNTKMDMRGRCSAGQRVLASLVLRLALAETFCLNCGVMALDEPTTNLDFENKRGLAIALAQIIASRAAQSNFQLVVITHDEDFVSMMKQELSTQTGFDMPERYFQVSREEGVDGRFYSKINAIDWDEI